MDFGTAEIFHRDVFAHDRFYDSGSGDKHMGQVVHHENEVGKGRRIHGASGTVAQYCTYLGYSTRALSVYVKYDPGVFFVTYPVRIITSCQFGPYNPCARGIIQADEGHPHIKRHFVNLIDLPSVHIALRSAHYGSIMCKHTDCPAINCPVSGYYTVSRSAYLVLYQHIEFIKTIRIQQKVDTFPG